MFTHPIEVLRINMSLLDDPLHLLLNIRVIPSQHQHQHHPHQLGPSQAGNLLKLLPPINQIPLVLAL